MSDCQTKKSVAILAVALLGFTLFQLSQILTDRGNLGKLHEQAAKNMEQVDKVLAENQKMLDQLNAIAIGTQRLANSGNPNAKEIVGQLTKLGIKINPNFKEDQEKAAAEAAAKAEGAAPAAAAPQGMTPPPPPPPGGPAAAAPAAVAPPPTAGDITKK